MSYMWLTNEPENQAKEQSHQHEGRVPLVVVDDGGDAQVHEDNRLTNWRQHLHEILNGRMRLLWYVFLHVSLHWYTTKRAAANGKNYFV